MISIAPTEIPRKDESFWQTVLHGLPRAFAVLFFSNNPRLGWFLLVVSMFNPYHGLAGVAAILLSAAIAWFLQYDRSSIRNGYALFNALLIGLSLGFYQQQFALPIGLFLLLFTTAVTAGFFFTITLQQVMSRFFALSAHSMPAVALSYLITLVVHTLMGPSGSLPSTTLSFSWMELTFLPAMAHVLLKAFAAMLFQSSTFAGLLVFVALVMVSPLKALMASLGVLMGCAVLHLFGYRMEATWMTWCSFNFLLCGITLGAGYYIPSTASLSLVAVTSSLCALLCIALSSILGMFQLSVSALPYNLTVLVVLYALRQRSKAGALVPLPAPGMLPEQAAQKVLLEKQRFPFLQTPALFLPFTGSRTITQAFDDTITHRGAWKYALDFECEIDGLRYAGDGSRLEDFFSYGTAVLSPCYGVVTAATSHVNDNAPGANNLVDNWGNYIMILCDYGYTVMLAHLKQHSTTVLIGQRVYPGMLLGLCGNSGRSPIPHLHVQVQIDASVGAPTLPFCLKHFIDGDNCYHTAGIPEKNSVIRSTHSHDAWLAAFSQWLPGAYQYEVNDGTRQWTETITLEIDPYGRYLFRSTHTQAQVSALIVEGVFYMTDFQGDERSLLSWLASGFARVPALADDPCLWRDVVTALPFEKPFTRVWKELMEPFTGMKLLAYEYQRCSTDAGFTLTARCLNEKIPASAGREISCDWNGRDGIKQMRVSRADASVITATLIDYQP